MVSSRWSISSPHKLTGKTVLAGSIADDEIGPTIYEHYLPSALEQGRFVPKPDPIIAGHGLGDVQAAVTRLKGGISASKLVVTL